MRWGLVVCTVTAGLVGMVAVVTARVLRSIRVPFVVYASPRPSLQRGALIPDCENEGHGWMESDLWQAVRVAGTGPFPSLMTADDLMDDGVPVIRIRTRACGIVTARPVERGEEPGDVLLDARTLDAIRTPLVVDWGATRVTHVKREHLAPSAKKALCIYGLCSDWQEADLLWYNDQLIAGRCTAFKGWPCFPHTVAHPGIDKTAANRLLTQMH